VDIIKIVLHDLKLWTGLSQLIKTTKPLVNAIGNLESWEASLADCMLGFIHCAHAMTRLQLKDNEDVGFWLHVKAVFNQ
jgi:hypothetical protein